MRAVGIVRVSERGEREGESFRSPSEQRERIEAACERDGLELIAVHEEIDVSGGAKITARRSLTAALAAIEGGTARVLIVAYFDRLFRSLRVQDEVVSRVEAAGGRVLALDFGEVTGKTAAQWLSSTMLGAMSEYYRRSIGERVAGAQSQAVARSAWPSRVPLGYARGESGVLVPDATAPLVRRAFEMRASGATIREVRALLREHRITRSYAGVEKMFRASVYLGEIHFGEMINPNAHEPIVDVDLWRRAQRVRVPRGKQAKSPRLLARLGVLRCGSCGARMTVGGRPRYPIYRCNQPDCPDHPAIMAHIAERVVVDAVKARHADAGGRASAESHAAAALAAADKAQADLDAAIRVFAGMEDEAAAIERLRELREVRDRTREEADHLRGLQTALRLNLASGWNLLTTDERRDAIRATVESAVVTAGGKGAERIRVALRE